MNSEGKSITDQIFLPRIFIYYNKYNSKKTTLSPDKNPSSKTKITFTVSS